MRTLEDEWNFTTHLIRDQADPNELALLRAAFFGGASACMNLMRDASSKSFEQGMATVNALREEIQKEIEPKVVSSQN